MCWRKCIQVEVEVDSAVQEPGCIAKLFHAPSGGLNAHPHIFANLCIFLISRVRVRDMRDMRKYVKLGEVSILWEGSGSSGYSRTV